MAVWTHYVATELQPELLEGLPTRNTSVGSLATITTTTTNGNSALEPSDESNLEPPIAPNGNNGNGMCTWLTFFEFKKLLELIFRHQ